MPAQQEAGIAKLYKVMSLLDVLKTRFEYQYSPHYIHAKLWQLCINKYMTKTFFFTVFSLMSPRKRFIRKTNLFL